jgi:hypothetical protein
MKRDREAEIKRQLRALKADPSRPGAAAEFQRLRGELEHLRTAAKSVRRTAPPADPDAEAIKSWPPELRARLRAARFAAMIDAAHVSRVNPDA